MSLAASVLSAGRWWGWRRGRLAVSGRIPSARLTANRRQTGPIDRQALDLLRRGEAAGSQQLRAEHGWEHEHATPGQARRVMAAAICADINRYGAKAVAVLVVSHTDAEDLADRIRTGLTDSGQISGPVMTGPGWTTDRDYQAGDWVLLHARCGSPGGRLVNGTAATVIGVAETGLTVHLDRRDGEAVLPARFVPGTRKDGWPNLSPAWARTVDGAWPISAIRSKWSPRRWPASPIPLWPPETTRGFSTATCGPR